MKVSAYSGSDFVNGKVNEDTFIRSLAAEKTSKDELEFVGSLLGNEIKKDYFSEPKLSTISTLMQSENAILWHY